MNFYILFKWGQGCALLILLLIEIDNNSGSLRTFRHCHLQRAWKYDLRQSWLRVYSMLSATLEKTELLLHMVATRQEVKKTDAFWENISSSSSLLHTVWISLNKNLILHTGAKSNFLSRNYQEFNVWKMWILWKIRLWNCEFCEKTPDF